MEEEKKKYQRIFDPDYIQKQIDEKGALWWEEDENYIKDLIEYHTKFPAPKSFLKEYYDNNKHLSLIHFGCFIEKIVPLLIKKKYRLSYARSFGNSEDIVYEYDESSSVSILKNVIYQLRPHSHAYKFVMAWLGENGEELHFSKLPELNLPLDRFVIEPQEEGTLERIRKELKGLNLKRQEKKYKFNWYMPSDGHGLDIQLLVEPVYLREDFEKVPVIIGDAINHYNEEAEVRKHGLIHYMSDASLEGQYIKFHINLGTGYNGVRYILEALDQSEVEIRNVRIW